jgi:hypothetical protein
VLQISGHDARVVRSVPVAPRRSRAELQPETHGVRRRLAGQPTEERDRFASVPQQSLVDRPPPHTAGRRRVERIEHTAASLPAHERQRCPSERQVVAVRCPSARGTPAPSMQDAPPDRRAGQRPAPKPRRARLRGGSSRGVIAIRRARPPARDDRFGRLARAPRGGRRRVVAVASPRAWRSAKRATSESATCSCPPRISRACTTSTQDPGMVSPRTLAYGRRSMLEN